VAHKHARKRPFEQAGSYPKGFAAREAGNTVGIAQAKPVPHQPIYVQFSPFP
jgi:hypothetical protein